MSADDANPGGTPLPTLRLGIGLDAIANASGNVLRVTRPDADVRRLTVQAAWMHGHRDSARLSELAELDRRRVQQLVHGLPPVGHPVADPALAAVVLAAGDLRFGGLPDFDHALARWRGRGASTWAHARSSA